MSNSYLTRVCGGIATQLNKFGDDIASAITERCLEESRKLTERATPFTQRCWKTEDGNHFCGEDRLEEYLTRGIGGFAATFNLSAACETLADELVEDAEGREHSQFTEKCWRSQARDHYSCYDQSYNAEQIIGCLRESYSKGDWPLTAIEIVREARKICEERGLGSVQAVEKGCEEYVAQCNPNIAIVSRRTDPYFYKWPQSEDEVARCVDEFDSAYRVEQKMILGAEELCEQRGLLNVGCEEDVSQCSLTKARGRMGRMVRRQLLMGESTPIKIYDLEETDITAALEECMDSFQTRYDRTQESRSSRIPRTSITIPVMVPAIRGFGKPSDAALPPSKEEDLTILYDPAEQEFACAVGGGVTAVAALGMEENYTQFMFNASVLLPSAVLPVFTDLSLRIGDLTNTTDETNSLQVLSDASFNHIFYHFDGAAHLLFWGIGAGIGMRHYEGNHDFNGSVHGMLGLLMLSPKKVTVKIYLDGGAMFMDNLTSQGSLDVVPFLGFGIGFYYNWIVDR